MAKITILKNDETFLAEIPAKESAAKNNLLSLWLFAWSVCGLIVIAYFFRETNKETKSAYLVWLGFWAYFEYKIASVFHWRKFGRELIEVKDDLLLLRKESAGRGKTREYKSEFIKNMTVKKPEGFLAYVDNAYWSSGTGSISFDYFGKNISFALQVDEKSATDLLKKLKSALKN